QGRQRQQRPRFVECSRSAADIDPEEPMTKAEQTRLTAWRCKVVQQATGQPRNVARTCRHFGISRQAFYNWHKRFKTHRAAGLCDRPRTPHRSPRATPREVVSKILYLRQHYHFGPGKIADYLKRFHQVTIAGSSVHRILGKHGLNLLPRQPEASPAPDPLEAV